MVTSNQSSQFCWNHVTMTHLLDIQRPSTQVMLIHSIYRLLHKLLIFELHHTIGLGKQKCQMTARTCEIEKKQFYVHENKVVSYPQPYSGGMTGVQVTHTHIQSRGSKHNAVRTKTKALEHNTSNVSTCFQYFYSACRPYFAQELKLAGFWLCRNLEQRLKGSLEQIIISGKVEH